MPVLKLLNFGGMIPATDPNLLPDNQAQLAENAWVYSGAVEGFRESVAVHTLANPQARRVYRVPIEYYDKDHIPDSHWLEFENADVDVLASPVVGDQYKRFYWAFSQTGGGGIPQYNTKDRIAVGLPAFTLGVPRPTVAPTVTRASGKYWLSALGLTLKVTGGAVTKLYYSRDYGQDAGSFLSGTGARDTDPSQYGATKALSNLHGNLDKSSAGNLSTTPKNRYGVSGQNVEMRYGTVQAGKRITISDSGTVTLGIPAALVADTTTDPYVGLGVQETRAYVYTWVSAYGEEGPPSPPTVYQGWSEDPWVIGLTAPTVGEFANRNLSKVRIYRTISGIGGATTYFFVGEQDIADESYTDSATSDLVSANNLLQSLFYDGPPEDLEGMVALPNGIVAGWRENEIWFSEPFLPHAWPSPYTLATEYPIIGMGVIGQSLIVCTTGSPYAVSGVNPATMTMSRLAVTEPCLSRASIVSTPQGVVYASPNGLALAAPGAVSIVTRNLITKDMWLDPQDYLSVPTLRAALLAGNYYTWGSVRPGAFEPNTFQADAFAQEDFTGAYHGAYIDVSNPRVSWVNLRSETPVYSCFADQWTGEVFTIKDGEVFWLDITRNRAHESYTWRSKIFEAPNKRSFEAMRIWFSTFPETPELNPVQVVSPATLADDMYGIVRIYADGILRFSRELRSTGEFMRLPSGFKSQFWEVEIEARVKLTSIELATSAKELANA